MFFMKLKKIAAVLITTMAIGSILSVPVNAISADGKEPRDIVVWEENKNETRNAKAYFEWVDMGSKYVYGYKFFKKIGRQYLTSYRWENLTDQERAKAVVTNYTYDSENDSYTYGWENSTDCYCRARIETASGYVCDDSGRVFGMYNSIAETYEPEIGIAKTYCGNLAAD